LILKLFINGILSEEIYIQFPEEVETNDKNTVCKLNKALYGLKQAARCWNKQFYEFLEKFNFQQSNADQCVYLGQLEGEKIYLALYVDNGLILTSSRNILNEVLEALNTVFEMTKGNSNMFIGMKIECDRSNNVIFIHLNIFDATLCQFPPILMRNCDQLTSRIHNMSKYAISRGYWCTVILSVCVKV